MSELQFILLGCYICLLAFKSTRYSAAVISVAYIAYQLFIIPSSDLVYYSATATLNLAAGVALLKRNLLASLCSFGLVFNSVLGFWLWYSFIEPDIYDNISIAILIIQLLSVAGKGLINVIRDNSKRALVKSDGVNGV